jgi:molybdenum cofactor cytidylyltransferase
MFLSKALDVQRGEMVAFIGAGGKTSAMLRLAYELKVQGWRVLATTTTRIAEKELRAFPHTLTTEQIRSPQALSTALNQYGLVFIYERTWGGKVIGVSPEYISTLADRVDSDTILIEADGSRRLPLKAPQKHEPVIPDDASLVVPVVGMNAIGQPLNNETVYNLAPIVERYGFPVEMPIQPAWVAQIVRDETLGLQGIPPRARVVPLLNQVGSSVLERLKARRVAQMILKQPRVESVAIGRVRRKKSPIYEIQRRVGAVVLAGGLSKRMGRSKPLLPWGHKTVIETIVERVTLLRLSDVVVVTGHEAPKVNAALQKFTVRSAHNPDYATGEMLSSMKTGLKALHRSVSACLVFLSDQPNVNARLVTEILIAYAEGRGTIVAPSYNMRRGHPILIDRRYWSEILDLPDGSAPRDVINAYPDEIAYVAARDDSILMDMDTPEEYRQALRRAGLL